MRKSISAICLILLLVTATFGQRYVRLSKAEWNRNDAVNELDYRECKGLLRREVYRRHGKRILVLSTFDDSCDGGSKHGVVYSRGKVIAFILDGIWF